MCEDDTQTECTSGGVCDVVFQFCCKETNGELCAFEVAGSGLLDTECFSSKDECLNMCAQSGSTLSASSISSATSSITSIITTQTISSISTQKSSLSSSSQAPYICGDGFINQSFETCDDGNITEGDGCSSTCRIENDRTPRSTKSDNPPICGDTILQQEEQCDDGNTEDNDGCNSVCLLESGREPVCGDTILTNGEECDYGIANQYAPNLCRPDCTAPYCGDTIIDDRSGEQCDDGNTNNNDGCSSTCLIEQTIIATEDSTPTLITSCGDGTLDTGEQCDDGNANDNDGCSANCLLEIVALTEDDTNPIVAALPLCGNGILESPEQCDDSNRRDKDGCDRYCRIELGEGQILNAAAPSNQQSSQVSLPQNFVAGEFNFQGSNLNSNPNPNSNPSLQFPTLPSAQVANLPLAQLQPLIQGQAPIGDTGPAAVAVIAAGAGSGLAWMRRKRKRKT